MNNKLRKGGIRATVVSRGRSSRDVCNDAARPVRKLRKGGINATVASRSRRNSYNSVVDIVDARLVKRLEREAVARYPVPKVGDVIVINEAGFYGGLSRGLPVRACGVVTGILHNFVMGKRYVRRATDDDYKNNSSQIVDGILTMDWGYPVNLFIRGYYQYVTVKKPIVLGDYGSVALLSKYEMNEILDIDGVIVSELMLEDMRRCFYG